MLVTNIFSFSHNVLYPIKKKIVFVRNIEIVVCKCRQFYKAILSSGNFKFTTIPTLHDPGKRAFLKQLGKGGFW